MTAPASWRRADPDRRAWLPCRSVESRPDRDHAIHTLAGPPPGMHRGTCGLPIGRPVPGRPPVLGTFGETQREGHPLPACRVAPADPRARPAAFSFGLQFSSGKVESSGQEGGRSWMGREHGGHATRPARRGTHDNGSGVSPAFWDSTIRPGTRLRRRPRWSAAGGPRPHDPEKPSHPCSSTSATTWPGRRPARVPSDRISPPGNPQHQTPHTKDHHVRSHRDDPRLSRLPLPARFRSDVPPPGNSSPAP